MTLARNTENLIQQQMADQQLPDAYRQLIDDYLLPLCEQLAQRRAGQSKPLVVGVNGSQGSGKSTVCVFIKLLLEAEYQLPCAVLSIDDFYLSRAAREGLAENCHSLLKTRGVPGTHDVDLAINTLESLLSGEAAAIPRFDKSCDDLLPKTQWPLQQPVEIIIFEGWCVDAIPQPVAQLEQAVNQLERDEDSGGEWRRFVNETLGGDYQRLFSFIDYRLMLKAPSMDAIFEWRSLQEQKLAKKVGYDAVGIMNAEQIKRFIQHYQRLTEWLLQEMPERADTVLLLSTDHTVQAVINKPAAPEVLIFTDLDGTLLDHHNYSFAAALPALERIAALQIPLIINSSKTAAEIIVIQQQLGICQPFISENGCGVYLPVTQGNDIEWQCQSFSKSRADVLEELNRLRAEYGYQFTGFADGDEQDIVTLTGLDADAARRAGTRDFSEPLKWQDSETAKGQFLAQLKEKGFNAQEGGRFLCIMGAGSIDKGRSMAWLLDYYSKDKKRTMAGVKPITTIALGDSPNDQAMLNAADIAVIIRSARSDSMQVDKPASVIRTQLAGPEGWQIAMDKILSQLIK